MIAVRVAIQRHAERRLNAMHRQLVFGFSLLFAAFSPFAIAQSSSSTGLMGGFQSNQAMDCSDPLLASSAQCQGMQQRGYMPPVGMPQGATTTVPQTGMVQPPTYNDTGGFNEMGGSRTSSQIGRDHLVPLPAQPLTEFQKFVAGTTGQVLPVFGANLFRNVPSTFAPVDQTPVPPDYVIGPGDELRIRIWGQVNFNANVRVDRSGSIYLPKVGQVHVAGLPYQALSSHIHDAVGRVFRNFDLTADIGQIRAVQVYVVGQAQRPGTYTVSSLSTLVDALFASGGPSVEGSMRHIYLKRSGKTVADFDLYDLLVHGDKSHDTTLQSGDVIFIPPAGPQVALTGSVRKPAIYELRNHNASVADLLRYAGGASAVASNARISIERITDHRDRSAMEVAFDKQGLATTLQQGDILRVFSILPMYRKTVTLRGNTANPGRFAWHKGMRLSDLIPDRASLLTRNYWWKRDRAGLPSPAFEPVPALSARAQPVHPFELPASKLRSSECRDEANSASQRCDDESLNPDSQSYKNGPGRNSSIGLASKASHQAGVGTIAERESDVVTENTAAATHHLRVTLPAPEIDWKYAVIERLDKNTLKTSLIPFDLGKLVIDHDPTQNLELQPGDIVTIFSQADIHVPLAQQTKFVRLEGEFVHAGTYSVKPGETLSELVARAGGLTADAYLYGSEFTRESTRAIQQQRIDDYVQNLQMEISRGAIAQTSSAVASAQDLASANAAATSERDLISQLQKIRATGRIVLELKPNSTGVASLPPITLEDEDAFIVPPRPSSVNVVGAVYDQNSFLYVPDRRVGDYLHLAGGPNRDADKKHAFIIRADGSVISRASANGIWGNGFNSLRMNPGDTIVVPEKTYGPSFMRGFLGWSQLFSQLALGAAAISIIK